MFKTSIFVLVTIFSHMAYGSNENIEIAKAIFDFGISKMKSCKDCEIEHLFLSVEDEKMDEDFFKHFFYTGLSISSQEQTKTDCEIGIRSTFTQKRGYALTVFEIEKMDKSSAKVEWGHWYSCQNYSTKNAIVKYNNGQWYVDESAGSS